MNALSCGPKASNISGDSDAISPRYIGKNPRIVYARVPRRMAQFVLKIENLSHIIGTAPILQMARAYGLRPRLWLLNTVHTLHSRFMKIHIPGLNLQHHARFQFAITIITV